MSKPLRLRLSRHKGFDLQALSLATNGLPAVNAARPSKWGNSYKIGDDCSYYLAGAENATAEQCVTLFRQDITAQTDALNPRLLEPLRGKNLACWCALGNASCHADVLLDLANAPICCEACP